MNSISLYMRAKTEANALLELYDAYGTDVYGLAMHMLQDQAQAEEVTQATFLYLRASTPAWEPDHGTLLTWLLGLTHATALSRLRESRLGGHEIDETGTMSPELNQLSSQYAVVINCSFFKGMSTAEIAVHLGISVDTVAMRIQLGIDQLRQLHADPIEPASPETDGPAGSR